ncbi:quinone-dependent dihydroorotate dehydrogenase [Leucobacter sp. UCMA 4100]|nr:quinone-dependent dihydroorotate dehydrogenase [Leucobacter sp. UCMA 4100]MDA3145841.1 quinone-dependent dihydroorotate dehydrogenase [Leucobacter sp. UCMA 4100]
MRLYPTLFKHVFCRMDPETAHHLAFAAIKVFGAFRSPVRWFCKPDPSLKVETLGLTFESPFGIAAGFDKNAEGIDGLGAIGFGHVEIGTVTPVGQPGNPKPRLFRLVDDRGVVNRMGFNNKGSWLAETRISQAAKRTKRPIIGANIGKNRSTPVEQATDDYVISTQRLAPVADYLAVNVSSPNTPGLRGLQELESLEPLLASVLEHAAGTPVLVKIAPDMHDEQIDAIVDLIVKLGLDGIIATNTTISREGLKAAPQELTRIGDGGLSGEPLAERALEVLKRIRSRAPEELCVISVGGITTADDVIERLDAGATLVQGFTAFLYEGPLWARSINRGLRKRGWRQPSTKR